jgi:phosphatidylinositol-3-phosphatase
VRRASAAAALVMLVALAGAGPSHAAPPPIKHVFFLTLENEDADSTFGPASKAPYLSKTLRGQGLFLPNYFAIGHLSLPNYIAEISGQGPNPYTQADAPSFTDFAPGAPGPDGQALGQGAVYPASVKTIADQLDAKNLTWGGFMEDMGNSPSAPKTCRHPAPGAQDDTQTAEVGDQYATRHNPYMYFHSIIDDQKKCDARVVPLDRLPVALASESSTPNYSYISPNLCHDGHDEPCVDGQPGGMTSANLFLQEWVPKILSSPAFKKDGLLMITLDEAESHDSSSCCGEKQGPNTPNNGATTQGAGGGRIGAVLLSPYIKPGSESKAEYNHYSMLRSFEDLFGLEHLGYAAQDGLKPFGDDVYTNPGGFPVTVPKPKVTLSGVPRRCHSGRFRARVEASGGGISALAAALDGKSVKSSTGKAFRVGVDCSKLSAGVHRLTGTATGAGGTRHRIVHFRRTAG